MRPIRLLLSFTILLTGFLPLISCEPEVKTLFQELSAERTGINFSNNLKEEPAFNIIEYLYFYNGGGVALGDVNNDGLLDVYFNSNLKDNKLYLNKGNFEFEDITEKAGVAGTHAWSTGAAMADVNGDGWLDINALAAGSDTAVNLIQGIPG